MFPTSGYVFQFISTLKSPYSAGVNPYLMGTGDFVFGYRVDGAKVGHLRPSTKVNFSHSFMKIEMTILLNFVLINCVCIPQMFIYYV